MTKGRVAAVLLSAGAVATLGALGWWWLVFREVIGAATMTVPQALPCLVGTSDLCSLAQALCKSEHLLGVKRYSFEAFWLAVLLLASGGWVTWSPAQRVHR